MDTTNWAVDVDARHSGASSQPIDGELLFGRQTEGDWLTERLDSGEPLLVIYGPTRIGKTALLRHLVVTLAHRYVAIYLDVGRSGRWETESHLLRIAEEIRHRIREQTAVCIEPPAAASFVSDPPAAWQSYMDTVAGQLQDRRLLLLIDNVDQYLIDQMGQRKSNAKGPGTEWIRLVLSGPAQIILAVEHRGGLAQILPDPSNPPPSFGLGTLDTAAAESLIKALVSLKTQIDPRATHRVVEITSHHPNYIRQFCRVLLDCCAHKSPLTSSDVEDALAIMLEEPPPEFPAIWSALTAHEQLVLSGFGAMRGTRGAVTEYDIQAFCDHQEFSLSLSQTIVALDRAVERGLLEKLGTNSYRFALELFRLWIRRYRTPEYVLRESQWRSYASFGAFRMANVRRAFARRPRFWMSVGIILLVVMVVVLQPAFRANPAPTWATQNAPIKGTELPPRTQVTAPTSVPAALVRPTVMTTLPGYDIACMARTDTQSTWQIHLLNSSTGERLPLTETESNERTPHWSPDGEQIVFASDRDGNREIYVMDLSSWSPQENAIKARNLSQNKAPDWQPAWSPIGTHVAFSSYRDDNWELYLIDVEGTNPVRLTNHPESDFSPTWSPDGSRVLFSSRRYVDADLFVLDVTSSEITQLTTSERNEFDPAWSPDGRWVAYVTQHEDQGDVYVMRADGADPINLTHSPYANDFQPTWTPDSQWVVFVSYTAAEGDHELYRMRPDGSNVQRLTDDKYDSLAPSWRPSAR